MKKILFGIFAHPDDEGFGPSGTLITMALGGVEVHLICLTRGEAGTNIESYDDLGAIRSKEWQKAGRLIGATSMKQFNYGDGSLCNKLYHEVAGELEKHIKATLATYQDPTEIEFMTFDTNGLTGHLDHVAASLIATYVFVRLAKQPPSRGQHFTRLSYFCLPPSKLDHDISFVYFPSGATPANINETVDVSAVFEQKLAVMRAHHSQRNDASMLMEQLGEGLKQESFRFLQFETSE